MQDLISSHQTIPCALITGGVFLILLSSLVVFPSVARTDIQHIQVGDTIFIYEQNLDITGLRSTGANPITSLRKYDDDNPTQALLKGIPVQDDTSFSPIPAAFGGLYGIYYAFNPTDGAMGSVLITEPSVSIDVVLANPYHADSIRGLSRLPQDTPVAFKIVATDVGSSYHTGALYPATVDIVLTYSGGAQLTSIQGKDFSRLNVSSPGFYSDDPGRPGAITFEGLDVGTYTVQAKWHDPASFDRQAPDSNILSFSVGGTAISPTNPPTPTAGITTRTTTTPVPETTPATTPFPPVTPSTPVPSTTPAPQPGTTPPAGTPLPSPTSAPGGAWPAVLSPALALIPFLRGKARK